MARSSLPADFRRCEICFGMAELIIDRIKIFRFALSVKISHLPRTGAQ